MEDGRIIITQEDISEFLKKENKIGFIVGSIAFLILVLLFQFCKWISGWMFWDIMCITVGLFVFFCFLWRIRNIQKINKGTYFTVTTDVLRSKDKHIIRVGDGEMRLGFQCDRYTMYYRHTDRYYAYLAYDMDYQTLYDTASIGDTYTLIKVKKDVILAYNNKFFDVQC